MGWLNPCFPTLIVFQTATKSIQATQCALLQQDLCHRFERQTVTSTQLNTITNMSPQAPSHDALH